MPLYCWTLSGLGVVVHHSWVYSSFSLLLITGGYCIWTGGLVVKNMLSAFHFRGFLSFSSRNHFWLQRTLWSVDTKRCLFQSLSLSPKFVPLVLANIQAKEYHLGVLESGPAHRVLSSALEAENWGTQAFCLLILVHSDEQWTTARERKLEKVSDISELCPELSGLFGSKPNAAGR
jgi:hypothetical protein